MYKNRNNRNNHNKRRKIGSNNQPQVVTEQRFKLRRYSKYAAHNYAYYAIPVKNDKPIGKSERIKFTNVFSPEDLDDQLSFNANETTIIAQLRTFKSTKLVVLWRFQNDAQHHEALEIQEYRLSYNYRFRASAIEAFNEYNKLIIEKEGWIKGTIQLVTMDTIEEDPWYLIEWEKKIQDLGVSKDSKKHFNLAQCDVIGISLHLNPLTNSRILQYCVASMHELCYKFGSTIVYFEPYLKYTTEYINRSEMNTTTNTIISKRQITSISKERNDYFFIGRTEMHNSKLFIASEEMWNAQNYIVERLYDICGNMNTPYYAEREMLLGYSKGVQPIHKAGFNVIHSILSKKLWFNPKVEKYVEKFMKNNKLQNIDDIQRKAIHASFNEKISIVSGGPGRGKSGCVLKGILYIMNFMFNIPIFDHLSENWWIGGRFFGKNTKTESAIKDIEELNGLNGLNDVKTVFVHVISFTGKAVSRVKEVLVPGAMYYMFNPMTIHRLLIKCKQYSWMKKVPTILIVDEVSMVSDVLFFNLLRTFSDIHNIILLGDVDQLPPIQPGNILKELIDSRCLPVTRLVKNYRQGAGSGLPDIADKIIGRESRGNGSSRIYGGWDHALNIPTQKNKNNVTNIKSVFGKSTVEHDCEVYGYDEYQDEDEIFEDIAQKVVELRDSNDLFTDCVVLTAKRVEVAKLNAKLQPAFMPDLNLEASDTVQHYYEGIKFTFVTGDRVMHLQNDYAQDMFNGDIGRVNSVNRQDKQLQIRLPDTVGEKTAELDNIQPAYSFTTHKSQGSEFKIVIIYISDAAQLLHVDQWLYTAFTRARQKVYIFGYTKHIIATVLKEMKYRRTFLKHRLQLQFSHKLNDLLKDELQDCPK